MYYAMQKALPWDGERVYNKCILLKNWTLVPFLSFKNVFHHFLYNYPHVKYLDLDHEIKSNIKPISDISFIFWQCLVPF